MERALRLLAVVSLLLSACGSATSPVGAASLSSSDAVASGQDAGSACRVPSLLVMTRNLYLGADIMAVPAALTPEELVAAATAFWRDVQRTDFPARAAAIADEIAEVRPDVVGLQEVALYRSGTEAVCEGASPARPTADVVELDFLAELQKQLARRGLHYDVAAQISTMDAELCIADAASPKGYRDMRYTDRDVMLVRHSLSWRGSAPLPPLPGFIPVPPFEPAEGDLNGGLFAAAVDSGDPQKPIPAVACFPIAGFDEPVCEWRGWTAVEVLRGDAWVRVFETHVTDRLDELTAMDLPTWFLQAWQDAQLVGGVDLLLLDPSTALPTVVLGDFNVYRQPSEPRPPLYGFLVGDPFPLPVDFPFTSPLADAWMAIRPDDPGFTWGFDDLLHGGKLTTTLDLVLATPDLAPTATWRVGLKDRAHGGLHPSDHAGLVTAFRVP